MRVAVLVSGYLRSFKINVTNFKINIIDKFENVDVYLHITENEINEDKYFNVKNRQNDIQEITQIIKPICVISEENLPFDKTVKDIKNTWVKYYKLNKVKKINEELFGKYDLVIKYRPDININPNSKIPFDLSSISIPNKTLIDKKKLQNENDEYLCDIMAFGSSENMDEYFDLYLHIDELSKKHGNVSENLLKRYIDQKNIKYKIIDFDYSVILSECNVFAIAGDSGSGKTTFGKLLKKYFSNSFMLECDRYHKWERSDPKWKEFTHLNPEANYISKMNNDIFDLKIGKTIYQVDYDHSCGKFTEKERIDSSDNLIVCGLHSLYTDNDHVYNIKIFIDTDVKLKTLWKIKRDVSKRGHTLDQIIRQIESRKKDYLEFIDSQKNKSDIIINFFTSDNFDFTDMEVDPNIHLNIFISKIFDIQNILLFLIKNKVEYNVSSEDGFFKITFLKYTAFNDKRFENNNYYDYIIMTILHLI